jgi:hypothetical protein
MERPGTFMESHVDTVREKYKEKHKKSKLIIWTAPSSMDILLCCWGLIPNSSCCLYLAGALKDPSETVYVSSSFPWRWRWVLPPFRDHIVGICLWTLPEHPAAPSPIVFVNPQFIYPLLSWSLSDLISARSCHQQSWRYKKGVVWRWIQ